MEDCNRKMNARPLSRLLRLFIVCQVLCVLLTVNSVAGQRRRSNNSECPTQECVGMSEFLRYNMDKSVDPCEDFYEYACGNFIRTSTVPEGFFRYTALSPFLHALKELQYDLLEEPELPDDSSSAIAAKKQFQACFNETELNALGLTQLLNIVQENGGWPMIVPGEFEYTKTWQEIQDTYTRMTGKGPLYTVLVYSFKVRSPINTITLDQPMQFPAGGLNRSDEAETERFIQFIVNVTEKFAEASGASVPRERLEQDARDLYNLLNQIEEMRDSYEYRARGENMTVAAASETIKILAPNTQWNLLTALQTIFRDVEGVTLTEDEIINVRELSYLRHLLLLLENTDRRVILNYIQFHFIEHYIGLTTSEMRNLIYNVYDTRPIDRKALCASMPNLGKALSRMYVKRYVPRFKAEVARRMLLDLKKAVKASIERTSFLDNSTREMALLKLQNLVSIVGFSEFYASDEPVDQYYSKYTMGTNYLSNILNYHEIEYRSQLALVKVQNDVQEYRRRSETEPTSTALTYRMLPHRLEVPAGVLIPPAFNLIVAPFSNLAGLGSMISLLLSDMYIDIGMFVNDQGEIMEWVSNTSSAVFDERTQCYVNQYKNYTIKELDEAGIEYKPAGNSFRPVLASLHFALKYAYEAHQANVARGVILKLPSLPEFNLDQQFFLNFASINCEKVDPEGLYQKLKESSLTTGRIKVNAALRNLPQFSETFNCAVGTPMNPPDKCAWFD